MATYGAMKNRDRIGNEPLKIIRYHYFITDDKTKLVRYGSRAEILTLQRPVWTKLESNSSYEREIRLGQGNNCLTQLTPEQVVDVLAEWLFKTWSNTP